MILKLVHAHRLAEKINKICEKILKLALFSEGREWIFGEINDLACLNLNFKPMEA